MPELTESQEKALIDAIAEHWHVSDAWDNILSENERKDAAAYFLAGVRWAQAATEPPLQRDSQTKGATAHRPGCKSEGHIECRAGPLWRCSNCRRQFCAEEGGADAWPLFCDDCYAAATQEGEAR